MAVTNISRVWSFIPSVVSMTSTDDYATISAAGYLTDEADNIAALNSGVWQWLETDFVVCSYLEAGVVTTALFTVSPDFTSFEPFSGQADVVLPVVNGNLAMFDGVMGAISDSGIVAADVMTNALASGHIFVGNVSNEATDVAMTGDIGISNAGVTAIQSGVIVNADINSGAAIAFSKLAALNSTQLLVGSAGNVATAVTVTGDVTIGNTGVTAIGAGKVLLAMLGTGIAPAAVIKFMNQVTTTGGSPAEAITVTGAVAATDRAFVQVVDNGTNNVTVLQAVVTTNTLTVTFSGDPGNDCIINYQLVRAAS